MRPFLTLLLLYAGSLLSQSVLDTGHFVSDQEKIRKAEMQRYLDINGANQVTEQLSVASNNFDIHYIQCHWQVDPAVKYISGKIQFNFSMSQTSDSIQLDLLKSLDVDSIIYHTQPLSFGQTNENGLGIRFPQQITTGTNDSIIIYYQGIPNPLGTNSFYNGTHAGIPVLWTLSEPYGASEWWPCKNGLNDKADSIDIYISCPSQYQPSSNGLMLSNTVSDGIRTTHFAHRYPIASYLIAMAVTNYEIVTDTIMVNNQVYPLIDYVMPELKNAFLANKGWVKKAFRDYSRLFGEYPFAKEKYGHTQWLLNGGMEHQTNTFVNVNNMHVLVHELGHQWFGDRVTCGSWQDAWLNEGMATYCQLLFLEAEFPYLVNSTLASVRDRATIEPSGSVFVYDTSSASRIFSGNLTYNKGAYVAHMLRWVLGDSAFFRGMRRYLHDPALSYGFAHTYDLQRNLEAETGKDLSSFFNKWVYGKGYPNYHADWMQNANNWVKISLGQTTSDPGVSFFDMPVELVLRGQSRDSSFVVDHQYSGQVFWLNPGFAVDTILIDPAYHILSKQKTSSHINGPTDRDIISIFPNPAATYCRISLQNPSDRKLAVQLFNNTGQLVFYKEFPLAGFDEQINIPLQNLAGGIYLLKVKGDKKINLVKKLIHTH
jgi:aminopeptidase N